MSAVRRLVADVASFLPIPAAHVVYEVLHVPHGGVDVAQYESTMRSFHAALRDHTHAVREELAACGRAADTAGVVWTRETRFALDAPVPQVLHEHAARARDHIAHLPLALGTPPRLYELAAGVNGAVNLDVLEHIVRDRIGIYRSVHGQHVGEAQSFVAGVRNLVHATGAPDGAQHGWTAVFYCTKPYGESSDFRAAFRGALDAAHAAHEDLSFELWERKLGLGRGLDVILRVSGLPSIDACAPVFAQLTADGADPVVRAALDDAVLVCGVPLPVED